jgi:hypothetical protein
VKYRAPILHLRNSLTLSILPPAESEKTSNSNLMHLARENIPLNENSKQYLQYQ